MDLPAGLTSCAHMTPGAPPESTAPVAACTHFQAAADAALATPPDSITGTISRHHSHAVAMAHYHACLAGH